MKKYIVYLLMVLATPGCLLNTKQNGQQTLYGTWRLFDIEPVQEGSAGSSFTELAGLKNLVKEGTILCFTEDGNFTELKGDGSYRFGTWKYQKAERLLQFFNEDKSPSSVQASIETGEDGRQTLVFLHNQQKINWKFVRETEAQTDYRNAPFHVDNNTWRIKPKQPESREEQIRRLKNYIKHVALILKEAKETKQAIVSFSFSQGPIKIYNGGIGVHPYEQLPGTWKNTFYNEADALSAYGIYEETVRTTRYNGAGTGNWVADDYNILLSLYAALQEPNNNPNGAKRNKPEKAE